jgi:hypothetical protein
MSGDHSIASGPLPTRLGNAVSDAIHAALKAGMEVDAAASIAVAVAADYWAGTYGEGSVSKLGEVITTRSRFRRSSTGAAS